MTRRSISQQIGERGTTHSILYENSLFPRVVSDGISNIIVAKMREFESRYEGSVNGGMEKGSIV